MTDISESGIEAALAARPFGAAKVRNFIGAGALDEEVVDIMRAAIQAYLPFHPPASREEGLREAAKMVAGLRDDSRQEPMGFKEIADRILALIPTKPEAKEQEDALYENLSRAELADTVARYGKALSEIANFSPKSDGFSAPTETAAFCQERARRALQSKKPE